MNKPSKSYLKHKRTILAHFFIEITDDIERKLQELSTEIAVDNYCQSLMYERMYR